MEHPTFVILLIVNHLRSRKIWKYGVDEQILRLRCATLRMTEGQAVFRADFTDDSEGWDR